MQPLCAAACARSRRRRTTPSPQQCVIAAPRHPRAQSRSFHTSSSPRSRAAFAFSRRSRSRSVHAKCSIVCLFEMGREKRKGKEVVVEKPARKRTRAEKEAERAEMVAKAAE